MVSGIDSSHLKGSGNTTEDISVSILSELGKLLNFKRHRTTITRLEHHILDSIARVFDARYGHSPVSENLLVTSQPFDSQ